MSGDGVPQYINPAAEQTQKILVARYAFRDVCACGATVHISPEDVKDAPPAVFYDERTFRIVACPACVEVLR